MTPLFTWAGRPRPLPALHIPPHELKVTWTHSCHELDADSDPPLRPYAHTVCGSWKKRDAKGSPVVLVSGGGDVCTCLCVALPLNYSACFLHPGLLLRDRTPRDGVTLPISSFFAHLSPISQTFPLFPSGKEFPSWKLEDQVYQASIRLSSVQALSRVWLFATPWTTALQASLSFTISRSPPKLMSIESLMPSNHLILCHLLLLLPSIFPNIRVFSNESALPMRWPNYWSFSFSISPSNEHPGLISFRMDWLDLFAVQGTLKSLLQNHSSKASILRRSAFFMVQVSHLYMTTRVNTALTIETFVGKMMSLFLLCCLSLS